MLIYSYPPQELANFRLRKEAHAACILDVSSYYIRVRILYLCPHIIYVSSGARQLPTAQRSTCSVYTRCVLILYVSGYSICVLILYMCPQELANYRLRNEAYAACTIYVSSYFICVRILYLCPHTVLRNSPTTDCATKHMQRASVSLQVLSLQALLAQKCKN
jgi:hypothetical protein